MKRYIEAEKLIAEIEKQKAAVEQNSIGRFTSIGFIKACDKILFTIASLQQEQPEPTCKTCGFYENNCPFTRGKLIPYPNKVCKDYTYSAMKVQSHFADTSKMEQSEGNNHINLPERIFLWEDEMKEFLAGKRKTVQIGINQDLVRGLLTYIRYDVAQEVVQPEVNFEKEIEEWFDVYREAWDYGEWSTNDIRRTARHFYELGLNARKEK